MKRYETLVIWATPNVFIADASALPTQGAANPALTVMAAVSRLAERLAAKRIATGWAPTAAGAAS